MTQTTAKPSKISLYDRDFYNLDVENLVEELEGLAGRDKRELKNRLRTLLEHLLKRLYV
jgi:hypothetical protein